MAASSFNVTLGVQWTPPSAAANSGSSTFPVTGTYNAQNVGQHDIPVATPPGTVFAIPFGSIQAAKLLLIRNMMSSDVGVRLNGHVTDDFLLPPGGELIYAAPSAPGSNPVASASIVTVGSPTVIENVIYFVMGD
jgi:hypothetical protein